MKNIGSPFVLCLSAALTLTLVGCSSSGGGTGASGAGGPAKTKLVYIPKNTGNPYFNRVIDGFKNPPAGTNIDFDTQAPAQADANAQISIIKDQIQRGEDVIVVSADSADALDEVLDQAHEKGITLLTVDADVTGNETHRDLGILEQDAKAIGEAQLDLLGKLMKFTGDFAILSAKSDAPNQNAWIAAMKEHLKQPQFAMMHLVDIVYGDDESQKSSTETESLLSKYPNLKGILSPTSVGLAAAAQVLENAGVYPGGPKAKNGGVQLTGLSTPNQLKKAVAKGVVTSFQLWDPADMGAVAAYLGPLIHDKKFEVKPGAAIDVPGKGSLKVEDKNIIYAAPMLTFDKSNIDKYDF